MMWFLLVASLVAAPGMEVELKTLAGDGLKGQLTAVTPEKLTLTLAGGEEKSILLTEVLTLAPAAAPKAAEAQPELRVSLTDGSELLAQSYTAAQGQATIKLMSDLEVRLPTRAVRSVRSGVLEGDLAQQWEEIAGKTSSSDLIVLGKASKSGGTVLDYLEGAVRGVSAATVDFDLNGSLTPVQRTRVKGFLYAQPASSTLPDAVCQLVDVSGTQWNVRTLALAGEALEVTTPSGATAKILPTQLVRLDFSSGKIVFLSDLAPESFDSQPTIPPLRSGAKAVKLLYEPKRDRFFFDHDKLGYSATSEHAKGLALMSRTEVVYRLPSQFRRFQATAGMHRGNGDSGQVRLVISGDKGVLFESAISAKDSNSTMPQGVPIDLDLAGTRRLKILVDYGDDQNNFGDYLDLCEARVTK